jgi:hypothetical protein
MCEGHCCLCELDLHECDICETPIKHGAERCERCSKPPPPSFTISYLPYVTPREFVPAAFGGLA